MKDFLVNIYYHIAYIVVSGLLPTVGIVVLAALAAGIVIGVSI